MDVPRCSCNMLHDARMQHTRYGCPCACGMRQYMNGRTARASPHSPAPPFASPLGNTPLRPSTPWARVSGRQISVTSGLASAKWQAARQDLPGVLAPSFRIEISGTRCNPTTLRERLDMASENVRCGGSSCGDGVRAICPGRKR